MNCHVIINNINLKQFKFHGKKCYSARVSWWSCMGILDPIYALCAISILIQDVRTVFIIRVYKYVLCGAIYNKLQARHGLNSIFFLFRCSLHIIVLWYFEQTCYFVSVRVMLQDILFFSYSYKLLFYKITQFLIWVDNDRGIQDF